MADEDGECDMEVLENDFESENADDGDIEETIHTYLPGEPLNEGEELVYEESAYQLYHQAHTGDIDKCLLS